MILALKGLPLDRPITVILNLPPVTTNNNNEDNPNGGTGASGNPPVTVSNVVQAESYSIAAAIGSEMSDVQFEWLRKDATLEILEALAQYLNNNKKDSNIDLSMFEEVVSSQLPDIKEEAQAFALEIIDFAEKGGDEECAVAALEGAFLLPGCGSLLDDEQASCPPGKVKIGRYCFCPPGMIEVENGECEIDCNTFDERIGDLLNTEGGFVNDPADPGGATNKGISWPVWKENAMAILGVSPTISNLQSLTSDQAKEIYKAKYWDPILADEILDGDFRWLLFDFHVNAGGNAIKTLQKTLSDLGVSITVDGAMGNNTLNAVNSFGNQILLYNTFKQNRQDYYDRISQKSADRYLLKNPNATESEIMTQTLKRFINGWTNRVNEFNNKTSQNNINVNC